MSRAYKTNSFPLETVIIEALDKVVDTLLDVRADNVTKKHGIYALVINKVAKDTEANNRQEDPVFNYNLLVTKEQGGCTYAIHKKEGLGFDEMIQELEALKAIAMLLTSV